MATFLSDGITVESIEEMILAVTGEIRGMDTEDREYDSIADLWQHELYSQPAAPVIEASQLSNPSASLNHKWYASAFLYWENEANCPLSDDGVLGGYGKLTPMDTRDSNAFLDTLAQLRPELVFGRVADCGAGIGRVTKHLLLPRFQHADLIEQSPRLLQASAEYIGPESVRTTCVELGLQDFAPAANTYDVIWIQWVIGHLHDLDFISFFRRCVAGLRPGGVVILKDNCTESWTFVVDKDDSSVNRSRIYMHTLFVMAGLNVILEVQQKDFPEELYPVWMFALVAAPDDSSTPASLIA